ncbi:MAG TPA: DUF2188 domain-containing protein [Actinomycetota bacterium]|nr:DUF2188 domain-containing protein [Actinomycetota bacterium]
MSERVTYHVTPFGNGWKVAAQGAEYEVVRDNKDDAVNEAKELAKQQGLGQVIVHNQDGKIADEFTYGEDPRDIPG